MKNTKNDEARIGMYFHCKTCTDSETLECSQELAVGWTEEGIQVVCENCGKSVIDLDFQGQKVGFYNGKKNLFL